MSNEKKTYKDTLNLPKTGFDMRANLLKKEPDLQKRWRDERLYERIRSQRQGAERFVLHDGPPYANGNIHMGTALNKVLKDMVVRIRNMTGFDAPYLPGWDCHGLPIEAKVMDELGEDARRMPPMDIRKRCRKYADKFVRLQSEQFQRLGILGQFEKPYITMNPRYESAVLEVFAQLVEKGLVYRQLKPVHWSIENRTALADAELEYHDRDDTSLYVLFPIAGEMPLGKSGKSHLLIWTTTPWTLPANLAVAVHPDFQYAAVRMKTGDGEVTAVVAEKLLDPIVRVVREKRPGWLESFDIVRTMTGRELVELDLKYEHPLIAGKLCPLVEANYVTLEDGTGLVHTAPGHGMEDYGTALKAGLEIYCPVKDDGTFDETVPEFLRGLSVWDGNALVTKCLSEAKLLLLEETIRHSYPHDWRSKTPTIFRATEQWFVAVDRPLKGQDETLRQLAMASCGANASEGGVDFIPAWGRNRITGMLESRPDWCLSRQRTWGLAIPVFYNELGQSLLTPQSVRTVARVFAEKGSDAWFTMDAAELLAGYDPQADSDLANPDDFRTDMLVAGKDIFDVWFESGSSWFAVAVQEGLVDDIPVDLYLEGSDQHRGWFQLSLLPAMGSRGIAPFRTVLTHGFVVTEDGHKMSKSLGNTIDAIAQLDKRGADVLRLWIASQNYQDDIRCSEELIAQASDAYRKIRNTLRFCMGACADFDPATSAAAPAEHSVDLWMRMELHRLVRDVRSAFDGYEFHRAMRLIYEFCTVQASSIYLSAVKDRLYCELPGSPRRRATQTVIHETLMTLIRLLAPILPHTCEEAWSHVPNRPADQPDSPHLALLPDFDAETLRLADDLRPVNQDEAMFSSDVLQGGPAMVWDRLLALRQEGMVKLETLRNAGVKNPLDAEVVFRIASGNDDAGAFLEGYLREMEDLLGVGYARIERTEDVADPDAITVEVFDTRNKYARCERSWKRRPDVGSDENYPDLSARDAAVIRQLSS